MSRLRSQEALILEKILSDCKHRYLFCWNGESADEAYDCACCLAYLTDELLCSCGCPCHERIDAIVRTPSVALWLRAMEGMKALPPFFSSEQEKIAYLEKHHHPASCGCDDCLFLARVRQREKSALDKVS